MDYAKLAPVLTRAIQELDAKISALMLNPGAAQTILTNGATFKQIFSSLGQWSIDADGTLMVVKVVTDEVVAKKLKVDSGLTTRDRTSGEYYCVFVDHGAVKSEKGECSSSSSVPMQSAASPPPTPASTPVPAPSSQSQTATTSAPEVPFPTPTASSSPATLQVSSKATSTQASGT